MPNLRKPEALLELNGAYEKNPKRRRTNVPASNLPLGNPPTYLKADERRVWNEILRNAPANVLTGADNILLETLSRMVAKFRRREDMTGIELTTMVNLLGRCGMTPSDRSKVTAIKEAPSVSTDPDAEFMN